MTAGIPPEEPAGLRNDARRGTAVLDQEFTAGTLHLLREAVIAHVTAAGLPESRATDIMLAVHELAANAIRHGGGTGQLRVRIAAGALHCQVTDPGPGPLNHHPPAAAVMRQAPWPYRPGHGLWLARQAADRLTTITGRHGSQVTASFALPSAPKQAAPGRHDEG
jgi:anti-sigma regulatory factor (Ser/Thr protein kinase)